MKYNDTIKITTPFGEAEITYYKKVKETVFMEFDDNGAPIETGEFFPSFYHAVIIGGQFDGWSGTGASRYRATAKMMISIAKREANNIIRVAEGYAEETV